MFFDIYLYKGLIGLALQNQELVELNQKLTQQLDQINQEREAKLARANRKRLPKHNTMTADIYRELIKAVSKCSS